MKNNHITRSTAPDPERPNNGAPSARHRWRRWRPHRRLTIGFSGLALPLLNMLLLTMLFGIMNSNLVLRPGINIELPQTEFVAGATYDTMVLILTQEGLIFFNDDRIPLEELSFALSRAAHHKKPLCLTIEADLRVQYGTVVRIINMAMVAGISQINLATRPILGEGTLP